MRKLFGAILWVQFCMASFASAHAPYFSGKVQVMAPEFGRVTFAVLHGDGIFFADPAQVVVYDKGGNLLAATKVATEFSIVCRNGEVAHFCTVYDRLNRRVFEPDFETWARGMLIAQSNGRPIGMAYPED